VQTSELKDEYFETLLPASSYWSREGEEEKKKLVSGAGEGRGKEEKVPSLSVRVS
jgi:hypothetical protein